MTCFKNPSRHMHRPLAAISSDKMGLDIVLTSNGQVPEYNPDNSISFEGGAADYWYLWPTMIKEIKNETGELIDLYDDAEFTGDNLDKIEKIISGQVRTPFDNCPKSKTD